MHCEEQLKLTRRCLELIDRYGYGLVIRTKSSRILRDLDLLRSIQAHSKCVVQDDADHFVAMATLTNVSVTTMSVS